MREKHEFSTLGSLASEMPGDGCHLDMPDDNLMTADELLDVKITHTVFDTSLPLVLGMEYQGRIFTIHHAMVITSLSVTISANTSSKSSFLLSSSTGQFSSPSLPSDWSICPHSRQARLAGVIGVQESRTVVMQLPSVMPSCHCLYIR